MKYAETNVIGRLTNQESLSMVSDATLRAFFRQGSRRRCVWSEVATGLIFAAVMLIWASEANSNGRNRTRPEPAGDQLTISGSHLVRTAGFWRTLSE